ncbi:DUF6197 family protein [Streptomyces microflavus]|uniref:DUF6197 family protein n=1 Tax=Streptomyces microflavus TaxID=1919 RepID=UPI0036C5C6CB
MTETTTEEFARKNLELAAEYISKHGWHQGDYYSYRATDAERLGIPAESHPPACALGAIFATAPDRNRAGMRTVPLVAMNALAKSLGLGVPGLIGVWNDDLNTTAEDVILALKKAATK